MKQFVRSYKLAWNFGFWVLFFVLVFFTLAKPEIIGVPKIYFSYFIGGLLIVNRIYLVEGRIKRIPYFLSLLVLLFVLVIIICITSSIDFSKSLSTVAISVPMSSYFFAPSPFLVLGGAKVYMLVWKALNLKTPIPFIGFLTIGLLHLAVFYPFVALHVKRLRDIRFSYWWTLMTLIPGVHVLLEIFLSLKGSAKRRSRRIKQKSQHRKSSNKRRSRHRKN